MVRVARPPAVPAIAAALMLAVPLLAQQPATTRPVQTVAAATAEARQWVGEPAREERIAAFAPAADIRYRVYEAPRPLRVWIAKIDLTHREVRFVLTEPAEFEGDEARFETRCATTLAFAEEQGVQLAINTSAFGPFRAEAGMPMDVVGLAAVGGEVYSEPDPRFGALYIAEPGHVQPTSAPAVASRPKSARAVERVALKGPPLPRENVWHVVPGFRMLIDDRRIVVEERVANSKFGGVNPRTALGADREGRTLWIVIVDGRQAGVSEGITLVELAALCESLEVWDALNLDGGGSTTFVLQNAAGGHEVINTPVGKGPPGTLRLVANNLGLYLPGKGRSHEATEP